MIRGMTGFGSAQLAQGPVKVSVEIKSLNNRYFDINFYLPQGFSSLENKIHSILQKEIRRGRVTVTVKLAQTSQQMAVLNKDIVKAHLQHIQTLAKDFKLPNDLSLSDVLRLPGVLEVKETIISPDDIWPYLEKCIRRATDGLATMRHREGISLAKDVASHLARMSQEIKKIQGRIKVILKEQKRVLAEEEFVSFEKNSGVAEEISRLEHYIDEIRLLLKVEGVVGKKIDFVAQEMQRETNTIGSKIQDKTVTNAVITLKSTIEKIREQSQNIE